MLESLKFRNFRLFYSGQFVSLIGTWMQMVAQGWLVYDITHSKLHLGLMSAITGIPMIVGTPFAGILADRINRRSFLVVTQIIEALCALLVAVLISLHLIAFWNLALISAVAGLAVAFESPTRLALLPSLVDKPSLSNAIALNSLAFNMARIIGPALTGLLIAGASVQLCYYINAVSFVAVIAGIVAMRGDFSKADSQKNTMRKEMKEALHFVRQHRPVWIALCLAATTSLFIIPHAVLMPAFARDVLQQGPRGLGILMTSPGIGAIFAALFYARWGRQLSLSITMMMSTFTMAVAVILFSLSPWFLVSCGLLVALGFGIVLQTSASHNILQTEVSDQMRGRLMSFFALAFLGAMPLGSLQAGIVSHYFGVRVPLVAGGIMCAVIGLLIQIVTIPSRSSQTGS